MLKTVSAVSVPGLARFVRWHISVVGSGAWSATFRIRVITNRSPYFVPPMLGNCVIWYRGDLGVTTTTGTSTVLTWADQSGTGDANKNLTAVNSPTLKAGDTNYAGQTTLTFTAASSTYMTSGSFLSAIAQPNTWVIIGHTPTSLAYQIIIDANDRVSGQYVGRTNAANTIIQSVGVGLSTAGTWSAPSVVLGEFNGASSKIFINNLTTAAITGNAGSGAGSSENSLTVGSQDAAWGPVNYWDGSVAEIIGFSGLLSIAAKAQLRKYIQGRYGIPVT